LLSRNSNDAHATDHGGQTTGTKFDGLDPAPAKRSRVKRAGQKAAAAAGTVSKAAKNAVAKAAKKAVIKTAKAAVAKTAKAAVKKAHRLSKSAAARDESAAFSTDKPRRKTRSDAGIKRAPRKAGVRSVSPVILERTGLGDAETSGVALASATAVSPQVPQGSSGAQKDMGN
jgi:hypothetical protein